MLMSAAVAWSKAGCSPADEDFPLPLLLFPLPVGVPVGRREDEERVTTVGEP